MCIIHSFRLFLYLPLCTPLPLPSSLPHSSSSTCSASCTFSTSPSSVFLSSALHVSLSQLLNGESVPMRARTIAYLVTGQNGIGQNGTGKMVTIFIDSHSTKLNFYSVTTSHK